MGRFCGPRNGSRTTRTIGIVLMAAGLVLLLLSVPSWMWATLLGIVLISVGFLIWRFA
ncbi:MAG: hypothetical protein ACI4MF_12615 [Candidatus Faecivicinus sp.]